MCIYSNTFILFPIISKEDESISLFDCHLTVCIYIRSTTRSHKTMSLHLAGGVMKSFEKGGYIQGDRLITQWVGETLVSN